MGWLCIVLQRCHFDDILFVGAPHPGEGAFQVFNDHGIVVAQCLYLTSPDTIRYGNRMPDKQYSMPDIRSISKLNFEKNACACVK